MYPAPSVIIFTVFSGLGLGLLAALGAGALVLQGWHAFLIWGLGYGLAVTGLLASTLHLGNPQRALRAFTQWRSSWLSREAWAAVATLLILAPLALSDWLGLGLPRIIGAIGAALALATIGCTAMIYTQLKTVPRWNHWTTPALFFAFALAGGAMLTAHAAAPLLLLILAATLIVAFITGDTRFAARGHSLTTATGLGPAPSVFEQPHTGGNYLMQEMIFRVGRKHGAKLRLIAVLASALLPAALLWLWPAPIIIALATVIHLIGAATARWLFFAQAEHVVGLYYGKA